MNDAVSIVEVLLLKVKKVLDFALLCYPKYFGSDGLAWARLRHRSAGFL